MLADVTTKQRFSLTSWFYTISIYPGKIALKGHSQKKKKKNLQLKYLVLKKTWISKLKLKALKNYNVAVKKGSKT